MCFRSASSTCCRSPGFSSPSPAFVYLDRPGSSLPKSQISVILDMLKEQGIGVVVLAKNGESRLHYDSSLEIKADGRWEVHHECVLGPQRRPCGFARLELLNPTGLRIVCSHENAKRFPGRFSPSYCQSCRASVFEFNANGSVRRIDHGDIMLNLFLGNEAEGGLANIHLRRLGDHGGADPPARSGQSGVLSKSMPRHGRRWDMGGYCVSRAACARRNPRRPGSGMSNWKTPETAEITCDLIHTQDIGARPLRRDPAQRILCEPVCGSHAARSPAARTRGGIAAEPVDGRALPVDGDRFARQGSFLCHGCAPVPRPRHPRRRRACRL